MGNGPFPFVCFPSVHLSASSFRDIPVWRQINKINPQPSATEERRELITQRTGSETNTTLKPFFPFKTLILLLLGVKIVNNKMHCLFPPPRESLFSDWMPRSSGRHHRRITRLEETSRFSDFVNVMGASSSWLQQQTRG